MRVALDFDILVVGRVILMRKKRMRTFDLWLTDEFLSLIN